MAERARRLVDIGRNREAWGMALPRSLSAINASSQVKSFIPWLNQPFPPTITPTSSLVVIAVIPWIRICTMTIHWRRGQLVSLPALKSLK